MKRMTMDREQYSLTSQSFEQTNPLRGLTLARAVSLFEQWLRGDYAWVAWTLWHVLQTDEILMALMARRTSALTELDWNIKEVDTDDPGLQAMAKSQAQTLRAAYERITNLYAAIEHLEYGFLYGYAAVQLEPDPMAPTKLGPYEAWNLCRAGFRGDFYFNPDARSTGGRGLDEEKKLNPGTHLIYTPKLMLTKIVLLKMVRQNLSQKDWDAFLEIYGIPAWLITAPPEADATKMAEFREHAEKLAQGIPGSLPNGATAQCADAPRGITPFEAHMASLNKHLVVAGTCGHLTMLAESGTGTLAGGAQADAFKTVARGEARAISGVFNDQFDRPILERIHPGEPMLAYFELAANEEQDVGDVVTHAVSLASQGIEMDVKQLSAKTGYKLTRRPVADGAVPMPTTLAGGVDGEPLATGVDVASTALNSAQIQSLIDLVHQVAAKELPLAAAEPIIRAAFPTISDETIRRIVAAIRSFTPTPAVTQNRAPAEPSALAAAAADQTLKAREQLMRPWLDQLAALEAEDLSETELLDRMEELVRAMPGELMTRDAVEQLGAIAEGALGTAVVQALQQAVQVQTTEG